MPRRSWKIPFAVAGDTSSIPTAAQSDGSVSIQQGYGPDYERPTDGTDPLGKVFPRTPFNGLANEITASIGEIQQYGFAIWSEDMAPYPASAWVRHAGKVWQNTIDSNSALPDAANSGWTAPGSGSGGGGSRMRITTSATFVVPDGVTTIYVSGCAGGGGGGAGGSQGNKGSAGGGGGGGAGRSIISEAYTVTGGQSIPVTIGVGGTGGGLNQGGSSGGSTTFGTLLSLAGGTGGGVGVVGDFGAGAPGGSPGGGWGTDGIYTGKGGDGGQGGSGPFGTAGGGARGRQGSSGGIAVTVGAGYGTGGGGGGAGYNTGGIGTRGGDGMPGMLLIEW